MIPLTDVDQKLELETSDALSTDFTVGWEDHTDETFTPGSNAGNVATATTTEMVPVPAADTRREVHVISIRNRSGGSSTVQVKRDVAGVDYYITPPVVLAASDSYNYESGFGWYVLTVRGARKTQGLAGETGATGPVGPEGVKGEQGDQGDRGYTGNTGPQGERGFVGADGEQGVEGPQGPTGPQGPQGEVGPQGIPGPEGMTGEQGEQGVQGFTGATGATGANGAAASESFAFLLALVPDIFS